MDEPSSAIGNEEIEVLFKQIFSLREQGVAILYITHKMDEIFRIADEITIIRDGKWIESGPAGDYDPQKLVARMVGREITNVFPKDTTVPIGDVILEVKDLTQVKEDGGRFRNISFQLHKGEILGFAGLVGAGRSEVMRAIFGLDPVSSGQIILDGKEIHNKSTGDAIKNGIAMVNEDRRTYGLVLGRDIHENVALVNMKKYTNVLIDDKKISDDVEKMREMLQIKIANEHVEAGTLSGGNQQKVVLAKWLVGDVKVMILDEPTRGIDVGAKSEIHRLMTEFAREGMGIIMISSELPEVLGMSDRIVVMQEGIIQGVLDRSEATQENIMELATRGVGDR
jgi:inositol transport system ATP-binding protein